MNRDAVDIARARIRLYTQFVNNQAEQNYSKIYEDMAWLLYWIGVDELLAEKGE